MSKRGRSNAQVCPLIAPDARLPDGLSKAVSGSGAPHPTLVMHCMNRQRAAAAGWANAAPAWSAGRGQQQRWVCARFDASPATCRRPLPAAPSVRGGVHANRRQPQFTAAAPGAVSTHNGARRGPTPSLPGGWQPAGLDAERPRQTPGIICWAGACHACIKAEHAAWQRACRATRCASAAHNSWQL